MSIRVNKDTRYRRCYGELMVVCHEKFTQYKLESALWTLELYWRVGKMVEMLMCVGKISLEVIGIARNSRFAQQVVHLLKFHNLLHVVSHRTKLAILKL